MEFRFEKLEFLQNKPELKKDVEAGGWKIAGVDSGVVIFERDDKTDEKKDEAKKNNLQGVIEEMEKAGTIDRKE